MTQETPVDPDQAAAGEEPTQAPPSGRPRPRAPTTRPPCRTRSSPPRRPASTEEPGGETREADVDTELDELGAMKDSLAERTDDLQRLSAEYVNYKRRVDRDRELIRENATYQALAPITEVLDTIDRAREHGELEGGFKAVADQLERVVARPGLAKFGAVGDAFDPTVHEALSHIGEDPEVEVTTCKVVAKAGYRIGDRVVRAAQVLVVDPVERRATGTSEPATVGRTARRSTTSREGRCAHECTEGFRADWAQKDFYAELGVARRTPTRRRDQEGLPQAGARQPPRLQPRRRRQARQVQGGRRGLRRRRRRREAQEVRRDARSSRLRRCRGGFGGGRRRRRRLRPRRPAARPGGGGGGGGFGDMFGDLFGGGGAAAPSARARRRAPTSRPPRRSASPTPSTASRSRCG